MTDEWVERAIIVAWVVYGVFYLGFCGYVLVDSIRYFVH
jgi:hypothetical protein